MQVAAENSAISPVSGDSAIALVNDFSKAYTDAKNESDVGLPPEILAWKTAQNIENMAIQGREEFPELAAARDLSEAEAELDLLIEAQQSLEEMLAVPGLKIKDSDRADMRNSITNAINEYRNEIRNTPTVDDAYIATPNPARAAMLQQIVNERPELDQESYAAGFSQTEAFADKTFDSVRYATGSELDAIIEVAKSLNATPEDLEYLEQLIMSEPITITYIDDIGSAYFGGDASLGAVYGGGSPFNIVMDTRLKDSDYGDGIVENQIGQEFGSAASTFLHEATHFLQFGLFVPNGGIGDSSGDGDYRPELADGLSPSELEGEDQSSFVEDAYTGDLLADHDNELELFG